MNDIQRFLYSSREQFASNLIPIAEALACEGICILQGCYDQRCFRYIAESFGNVQRHIRSNDLGITGDPDSTTTDWKKYQEEYLGTLQVEQLPHTDGSYLQGFVNVDGVMKKVSPPSLILLQCIQKADFGGANILVDLAPIVQSLREDNKKVLDALLTSGSVYFCRDDQLATECSVLSRINESRMTVRYNGNRFMYIPQWAMENIRIFATRYVSDTKFQKTVVLNSGDILLIDNLRVLHGRELFRSLEGSTKRKIRRLWVANRDSDYFTTLQGTVGNHRALEPYKEYLSLSREFASREPQWLELGIKL